MGSLYLHEYLPLVRPLPKALRDAAGLDRPVDDDLEADEPEPSPVQQALLERAIRRRCRLLRTLAPRPPFNLILPGVSRETE